MLAGPRLAFTAKQGNCVRTAAAPPPACLHAVIKHVGGVCKVDGHKLGNQPLALHHARPAVGGVQHDRGDSQLARALKHKALAAVAWWRVRWVVGGWGQGRGRDKGKGDRPGEWVSRGRGRLGKGERASSGALQTQRGLTRCDEGDDRAAQHAAPHALAIATASQDQLLRVALGVEARCGRGCERAGLAGTVRVRHPLPTNPSHNQPVASRAARRGRAKRRAASTPRRARARARPAPVAGCPSRPHSCAPGCCRRRRAACWWAFGAGDQGGRGRAAGAQRM
jgi:hypothetical protein